ncbi:MAG: hypothetical protein U0L09_06050 [Christensenellales bacterium]|nr:hypothetical protein [Christensenellales bacterium]
MGMICIFLGLIVFLCSIGLGVIVANFYLSSPLTMALVAVPSDPASVYLLCIGVCSFIGMLICLNLVMHGLTYNRLVKIQRRMKRP